MHVLLVSWLLGLLPESFDPFFFFCVVPFLDVHKEGILDFLDDFKRLKVEGLLTQEWSSVHPKGYVIYLCDVTLFAN